MVAVAKKQIDCETQEEVIARITEQVLNHTREVTAKIVSDAAMASAKAVLEEARAKALVLSEVKDTTAIDVAELKKDIAYLKDKYNLFETDVNKKLDALFKKLDVIILGRPTWGVTIILTMLSSLCVGLIVGICVYLMNHAL
jgi:hypothetical protein